MPVVTRSKDLPYPASAMYALVSDIESYPEFLPGCASARILEQSETHQLAELGLSSRLKFGAFTTRNALEPERRIRMSLVDGPFRRLDGTWEFLSLDEHRCRATLELQYEFGSRLLAAMLGSSVGRVTDKLVNAFVQRAHRLMGGAHKLSGSP